MRSTPSAVRDLRAIAARYQQFTPETLAKLDGDVPAATFPFIERYEATAFGQELMGAVAHRMFPANLALDEALKHFVGPAQKQLDSD